MGHGSLVASLWGAMIPRYPRTNRITLLHGILSMDIVTSWTPVIHLVSTMEIPVCG